MGRNRGYDETTVLAGAMEAFRRQGYEGASVKDLETATGLKAGSIYNSFGDKAGLFAAALAHYNLAVLQRRIDRFAPPDRGLQGLRALFLSLLREPDGGAHGCLITNSAVELGARDGVAAGLVDEGLETLRTLFEIRLRGAAEAGALKPGLDPEAEAALLLALYQGVLVLIRAARPQAVILQAIHQAFDGLERNP